MGRGLCLARHLYGEKFSQDQASAHIQTLGHPEGQGQARQFLTDGLRLQAGTLHPVPHCYLGTLCWSHKRTGSILHTRTGATGMGLRPGGSQDRGWAAKHLQPRGLGMAILVWAWRVPTGPSQPG